MKRLHSKLDKHSSAPDESASQNLMRFICTWLEPLMFDGLVSIGSRREINHRRHSFILTFPTSTLQSEVKLEFVHLTGETRAMLTGMSSHRSFVLQTVENNKWVIISSDHAYHARIVDPSFDSISFEMMLEYLLEV